MISKNKNAETVGVAAKVAYPSLALFAIGVLLCVGDQLGIVDVDDEIWITLLGSGAGVFGVGGASPASLQRAKSD
jgi:hypothetical protein